MQNFPDDLNGDVLRRLQAVGDNLEKARDIEFNHLFPSEENAQRFCDAIRQLGYKRITCEFRSDRNAWDTCVTVFMTPTHVEITSTESKFGAVAREFIGYADGWGCFEVK